MIDSVEVAAQPWVFSQVPPLTTSTFISEAKRRGLVLDPAVLRELYRHGDLSPFLRITGRRCTTPVKVHDGPKAGSIHRDLLHALTRGRVEDPSRQPFRSHARFDGRRLEDPPRWHNGMLYSRWQLLDTPVLTQRLARGRRIRRDNRDLVRLPKHPSGTAVWNERSWHTLLTAIDARYLPLIQQDWMQLKNADLDEWERYRAGFNPSAVLTSFGVTSDEVAQRAQALLLRADHLDPTGPWSELISRAPTRAWSKLSGPLLVALEHRIAAEMLLRLHADLVAAGAAAPLDKPPRTSWHPLHGSLSESRRPPLDEVLTSLGVSPHPGVVLALEGETEEATARRVIAHLGLRTTPDHIQILCLRSADKNLATVGALAVSPLVGERRGDVYETLRPATQLLIAIDPDQHWNSPAKVEKQRRKILEEIERVVAAQGAKLAPNELEELVKVETWTASCFEFEHFTDRELTAALRATNRYAKTLDRTELLDAFADARLKRLDVKAVWNRREWAPQPSKVRMATRLWPVLRAKIDRALADPTVEGPTVAQIVTIAHRMALEAHAGRYVYTAV